MAFQFVPNESGGFDPGDKQTNPETGIEYIYLDGAWRALGPKIEDEFETLDARYATKEYVDDAVDNIDDPDLSEYLPKSGGELTGTIQFKRGSKPNWQFKISPNSDTDYATNIYTANNGPMRFRTSHTEREGDNVGSHIVLDPNDGTPETKIYNVVTPTRAAMAASKDYVDQAIAQAIADAIGSDGGSDTPAPILRPALLSWKYEGADTGDPVTPGSGGFRYHTSSSGNNYLRFSFNSHNGCKIGDGKFDDTAVNFDYGPVGTIWEWMDGSVAKFKLKRQFRIQSWRWNYQISSNDSRHFEFRMSTSTGHDWSTFTANKVYFISVGGFF